MNNERKKEEEQIINPTNGFPMNQMDVYENLKENNDINNKNNININTENEEFNENNQINDGEF